MWGKQHLYTSWDSILNKQWVVRNWSHWHNLIVCHNLSLASWNISTNWGAMLSFGNNSFGGPFHTEADADCHSFSCSIRNMSLLFSKSFRVSPLGSTLIESPFWKASQYGAPAEKHLSVASAFTYMPAGNAREGLQVWKHFGLCPCLTCVLSALVANVSCCWWGCHLDYALCFDSPHPAKVFCHPVMLVVHSDMEKLEERDWCLQENNKREGREKSQLGATSKPNIMLAWSSDQKEMLGHVTWRQVLPGEHYGAPKLVWYMKFSLLQGSGARDPQPCRW